MSKFLIVKKLNFLNKTSLERRFVSFSNRVHYVNSLFLSNVRNLKWIWNIEYSLMNLNIILSKFVSLRFFWDKKCPFLNTSLSVAHSAFFRSYLFKCMMERNVNLTNNNILPFTSTCRKLYSSPFMIIPVVFYVCFKLHSCRFRIQLIQDVLLLNKICRILVHKYNLPKTILLHECFVSWTADLHTNYSWVCATPSCCCNAMFPFMSTIIFDVETSQGLLIDDLCESVYNDSIYVPKMSSAYRW